MIPLNHQTNSMRKESTTFPVNILLQGELLAKNQNKYP